MEMEVGSSTDCKFSDDSVVQGHFIVNLRGDCHLSGTLEERSFLRRERVGGKVLYSGSDDYDYVIEFCQ